VVPRVALSGNRTYGGGRPAVSSARAWPNWPERESLTGNGGEPRQHATRLPPPCASGEGGYELGSAAACPVVALGRQPAMPVIGCLTARSSESDVSLLADPCRTPPKICPYRP
jgi:hypothetical protein